MLKSAAPTLNAQDCSLAGKMRFVLLGLSFVLRALSLAHTRNQYK